MVKKLSVGKNVPQTSALKPSGSSAKEFIARIKRKLQSRLDALMNGSEAHECGERNGDDVADGAFEAQFQDVGCLTQDLRSQEIKKFRETLDRIRRGIYGQCAQCGAFIPKERLRAVPYSPYCIDHADDYPRSGVHSTLTEDWPDDAEKQENALGRKIS